MIANMDNQANLGKLFKRVYDMNRFTEEAYAGFCKTYAARDRSQSNFKDDSASGNASAAEIEKRFVLIFAMQTSSDRERIILELMRRKACDRLRAMEFAVNDWERDNRSTR